MCARSVCVCSSPFSPSHRHQPSLAFSSACLCSGEPRINRAVARKCLKNKFSKIKANEMCFLFSDSRFTCLSDLELDATAAAAASMACHVICHPSSKVGDVVACNLNLKWNRIAQNNKNDMARRRRRKPIGHCCALCASPLLSLLLLNVILLSISKIEIERFRMHFSMEHGPMMGRGDGAHDLISSSFSSFDPVRKEKKIFKKFILIGARVRCEAISHFCDSHIFLGRISRIGGSVRCSSGGKIAIM